MNKYFVYILKCSDNSYYTGITNDIDRRIVEHDNGLDKKSYTFSRRPLSLVYSEVFQNPHEAIKMEKRIKG
jgi:putative endonuclease